MSVRFGLDLGRRSVKLVRVDSGRRAGDAPRSVRGAARDIPPELEGQERHQATVEAIRACAQELGALGREVAVAVPRSESVVKTVQLPPVSAEERAKLIRFQAAKDVPFELSEVVLASGVVGESGPPASGGGQALSEVLYAAVRTTVLETLRALVREAGLIPGVLEVSTQAAARAARLILPEATDAVLVQIGALATDISVLQKGKLAFSRSASVGHARNPVETGAAEAERWLERLVAEVQRSLRAAAEAGQGPKVVLVAGGGAQQEGVIPTLAARLGLPALALDPTGDRGSPALLVARGLADARPVEGIPILDLAGRADAAEQLARRRTIGIAAGLLALLLLTGALIVRKEIVDRETSTKEIEKALEHLSPRVEELRRIEKETLTAQGWRAKKGRSLDVLLAVSNALPRDEAYLTRLTWSEGHTILLGGRARDDEAVQHFLNRLARDPLVERASWNTIVRPEKDRDAEAKGLNFQITVKLRDVPLVHASEEKRQP
jgi:type IV pilus assembly protein PilM